MNLLNVLFWVLIKNQKSYHNIQKLFHAKCFINHSHFSPTQSVELDQNCTYLLLGIEYTKSISNLQNGY